MVIAAMFILVIVEVVGFVGLVMEGWVCWVGHGGDVCLGGGGSRFGEGKALLLLRDGGCREGEGNLFSVN